MQLLRPREALAAFAVERRRLVRILAVAQVHELGRAQAQIGRQGGGGIHLFEARANGGIVIRGCAKGVLREAPLGLERQPAARRPHLLDDGAIIRRRHHHGDILVILGRRPDHGWPADIDVLDEIFEPRVGFGRGVFEAVEVDHHHVDGRDPVLFDGAAMRVIGADGQNSARDLGVQGLNAPVEHLGEAGDFGDVFDGDARLAEQASGSAGGDDLRAHASQLAGEFDGSGLVGNTDEYALDCVHLKAQYQSGCLWRALAAAGIRRERLVVAPMRVPF